MPPSPKSHLFEDGDGELVFKKDTDEKAHAAEGNVKLALMWPMLIKPGRVVVLVHP